MQHLDIETNSFLNKWLGEREHKAVTTDIAGYPV